MSTHAIDGRHDRPPDVERAAERLARPAARIALAGKRLFDVALSLAMLAALLPVLLIVGLLLAVAGEGWIEQRLRAGRHGRSILLSRFQELPGGALGRALERIGARELPLLVAVLCGRMSFV